MLLSIYLYFSNAFSFGSIRSVQYLSTTCIDLVCVLSSLVLYVIFVFQGKYAQNINGKTPCSNVLLESSTLLLT